MSSHNESTIDFRELGFEVRVSLWGRLAGVYACSAAVPSDADVGGGGVATVLVTVACDLYRAISIQFGVQRVSVVSPRTHCKG